MRNIVAILAAVLLLAACATGPRPVPEDRQAAWEELRARLETLQEWRADGRLAVRTAEDGGQAGFTWTEHPDGRFRLRLAGPWGQGATRLLGGDGSARLVAGDGRRYVGADARSLLAGLYGWNIPVEGLRRWLVGLPGEGAEFTLDRFGRIETLRWQGWRLEYGRYRPVGELELPAVLRARHPASGTEVRVAIDDWRIGAGEGDAPPSGSPVPLMGS